MCECMYGACILVNLMNLVNVFKIATVLMLSLLLLN